MSGVSNVLNKCFQITSYIILQQQLIHNVSKKEKSDTEIKCDLTQKGYARG